jgi:AcrR family transcriptional regulator
VRVSDTKTPARGSAAVQPSKPSSEASKPSTASKPLRADAQRNREQLLVAASDLFTTRGVELPLEEVARQAGVGIGTLYRHFPTRDALIEAVYRREVETLCDGVEDLLAGRSADEALSVWMSRFAVYVARKRGMAMALKAIFGSDSQLFAESQHRIRSAIGMLVTAAVNDGAIRDDVAPDDLMRAVGGICMATDTPDWQDRTSSLVELLMDGMRYGAAGSRRT